MADLTAGEVDHGVGVSFFGPDFVLTVVWAMAPGVDEDQVIDEAAAWFRRTYGFDVAVHSERAAVNPLPAG